MALKEGDGIENRGRLSYIYNLLNRQAMINIRIKKHFIGLLILLFGAATYYYIDIRLNLKEKEEACFAGLTIRLADGKPAINTGCRSCSN